MTSVFCSPNRYLLNRKNRDDGHIKSLRSRHFPIKVKQEPDFKCGKDLDYDGDSQSENISSNSKLELLLNHQIDTEKRNTLKSDTYPDTKDLKLSFITQNFDASGTKENFDCPLCGLGLSNGDDLEQHFAVHAGEKDGFDCNICGKVWNDASSFGKHIRLHTGERPHRCHVCGKSFREKCSLTRHSRTHTGERPFTCEICEKSFSDVGSYGRHKKIHMGNQAKVHRCPYDVCDKSFIDKSSLKRHIKTHSGERPYQCQVCFKAFTESGSYKRHQRVHSGEKRFKCQSCGRAFTEKASMIRHQRNVCSWEGDDSSHDTESAELDVRTDSPIVFHDSLTKEDGVSAIAKKSSAKDRKSNTNNNIISSNIPDNSSICDTITNINQNPLTSPLHVKKEPSVNNDPGSSSDDCNDIQQSSTNGSLTTSPKLEVSDIGDRSAVLRKVVSPDVTSKMVPNKEMKMSDTYMCFECGDAISDDDDHSNDTMNTGSSNSDEDRKARRCKMCRYGNTGLAHGVTSSLKTEKCPEHNEKSLGIMNSRRLLRHSHVCVYCKKSFSDSSKLKRHTKIHIGSRDFKCATCGKAFIEACSLRRHESVHSDVKPHTCAKCGKGFTDSSGLKKHMLKCNVKVKVESEPQIKAEINDSENEQSIEQSNSGHGFSNLHLENQITSSVSSHSEGVDGGTKSNKSTKIISSLKAVNGISKIKELDHSSDMLYVCTECGHSCEDARSLRRHQIHHVRETCANGMDDSSCYLKEPFSCIICNKVFVSPQYLAQHMQKHHAENSFNEEEFSHRPRTDLTVSAEYPLYSASTNAFLPNFVSNSKMVTKSSLTMDQLTSKPVLFNEQVTLASSLCNSKTVTCGICGKTFADSSSLKRHARLHVEAQKHRCEKCCNNFMDASDLITHLKQGCVAAENQDGAHDLELGHNHHKVTYPCTQCSKVFSTQEQLVAHEKAHRVMPALSCTVCRKSFGDSIGLQNHMSVHAGERPFACDICLKAFADSGSLAKHRARGCYPLSAMCLDLTKLPCNDCGKVFSDQGNFDLHMSSHRGVKPYSCSQCGKSFTEACSLKRHTRLHTGQNLCRCLHCGRTFLENSGLKKHLERRSCQRERKAVKSWLFPCTLCRKVFAKRYILLRHMKTHLGLRPHACDQCNKTFTEASSLKRHYRQHTGERPYSCPGCSKTFSDAGVMKKHKQRCPFVVDNDELLSVNSVLEDNSLSESSITSISAPSETTLRQASSLLLSTDPTSSSISAKQISALSHTSTTLETHHLFQTQAQRLKWQQCGKKFVNIKELSKHRKTAHTGVMPFSCTFCWRKFTRRWYLHLHKRCHQGAVV